jgi:hypothetical protein
MNTCIELAQPDWEQAQRRMEAPLRKLERAARSPWANYHPTGNYYLDRPAWELCHIKALRQRDPEPSWYDAQAHDAWLAREQRRQAGERVWSLPQRVAEYKSRGMRYIIVWDDNMRAVIEEPPAPIVKVLPPKDKTP